MNEALAYCRSAAVRLFSPPPGLLDGRRATTHWMYTEQLSQRYPAVRVEPGVLYVDEGRILTSAGSAAGIDLCLYVIRTDFGASVANTVARRLVVPPHRDGGQSQFIDHPMQVEQQCSLSPLLDWVRGNLTLEHSVESLADRSGLSPRTFARRFQPPCRHKPPPLANPGANFSRPRVTRENHRIGRPCRGGGRFWLRPGLATPLPSPHRHDTGWLPQDLPSSQHHGFSRGLRRGRRSDRSFRRLLSPGQLPPPWHQASRCPQRRQKRSSTPTPWPQ